jgi:glycosyltransferase involved in cell wall biosynthesis
MLAASSTNPEKLRILHCFRSPVGGIYRHVKDLILQQAAEGHAIGIICDSNTGGPFEEGLLAELEPRLDLGLFRISMNRSLGPRDLVVMWKLYKQLRDVKADILHSHGAKGGAYARLIGTLLRRNRALPVRLYCPHGGSVHYDRNRLSGRLYFGLERMLERFTDRLIFVSAYERDSYFSKVGKAHCPSSLVRNGLNEAEFVPVSANDNSTDFLYIGMMRDLKGVDLLIDALPQVTQRTGLSVTATLVGDGPDLARYKDRTKNLPDNVEITFCNPMPVREAFALGKILVVPSRAESMPYIVLEALAAKRPILATRVGGVPEIFAEYAGALVEPDDVTLLANAMAGRLSGTVQEPDPDLLHDSIKANFSAERMAQTIMAAYQDTLPS